MGVIISGRPLGDLVLLWDRSLVVADCFNDSKSLKLIDDSANVAATEATRFRDPLSTHPEVTAPDCMAIADH
jgi:hypothetical protein